MKHGDLDGWLKAMHDSAFGVQEQLEDEDLKERVEKVRDALDEVGHRASSIMTRNTTNWRTDDPDL